MKQIFVVRHGETDFNRQQRIQGRGIDASLNDRGKEQARLVKDALEPEPIERVIVSSLRRTHETAKPLVLAKGLAVEGYQDLDEISFGNLEGRPFNDIKPMVMDLHTKWSSGQVDVRVDGGESPTEVFERAHTKALEIIEMASEEHLLFVLHGRLIRILLSEWLGLGLKNMHEIAHTNGSINKLVFEKGRFEAVYLNKTEHLNGQQSQIFQKENTQA
ncbi:MAG: histidine phosphatase family protein [Bacteroidota bacterium]